MTTFKIWGVYFH